MTITSVNDRPSNVPNYYYNQVNEYILVPNRGEFLGEDALNYAYEVPWPRPPPSPPPPRPLGDEDRQPPSFRSIAAKLRARLARHGAAPVAV